MKNTNCSIDIIGPYPPPFGGISIHISRMLPLLRASEIQVTVYNQYNFEDDSSCIIATNKSIFWWVLYLFKTKGLIVHIHQFAWFQFPYVFLLSKISRSKIFFTIHNERLLEVNWLVRKVMIWLLKYSSIDHIIVVSKSLSENMTSAGVKSVEWLPAYVPPNNNGGKSLPGDFYKKVAFNVWRLESERDINVYAVDQLLVLAKNTPEVGFYIFVGDIGSKDYAKKYIDKQVLNNVIIIFGESLVDYLADADLFLRLNRSDAYGVSVQEALDLDVPVIGSNVCDRAPGTILYEVGNIKELSMIFCQSLPKSSSKSLLAGRIKHDYHLRLISMYKTYFNLKRNV